MKVIKGKNHFSKVGSEVLFYAGEFGYCFSNFSAFTVLWRGRTWLTSEHVFQAAGFDHERIVEEIFNCQSAHDALLIAIQNQHNLRAAWDTEKVSVMKDICRHKLQQHPYVRESLVASKSATLIEDSPKDDFWGCGADGNGQNHLGKIWMELREEL
jgi:ribA/ribD-fused uncharacterized protein